MQRLNEQSSKDLPLDKRQSELTGNRKNVAEMTTYQRIKLIKKLHWEEEKSLRDIAREIHKSWWWLMDKVKKYKIPVRTREESIRISFKKKRKKVLVGKKSYGYRNMKKTDGYWAIKMPEHPNANKSGYVMEHRLVMSEKIGRPLKKDEVVHHIDGNRFNNNLNNLALKKMGGRNKYHGIPIFCPKCGYKIFD